MCTDDNTGRAHDHHAEVSASMPRPVESGAVDPIALEPVDEVVVTTLVDNSYDGLMVDMGPAKRKPMGRTPPVPARLFEEGATVPGMLAEHGFSALVSVRRGERTHTLLFDTGVSPGGTADNMERLALDVGDIETVVLSHGHFDHAGGFEGLAQLRGRSGLPLTLHPPVWTHRRIALPGRPPWDLPTLRRSAVGTSFVMEAA
jgi:7,8-dihydropterin-6-yl-methyl-4-(beta-D-ribofuranosyl)aminobenzene 5'-phosphate synthase